MSREVLVAHADSATLAETLDVLAIRIAFLEDRRTPNTE
jgi:hypothetical protein